mgnify:CR=1 FL=1
MKMLRRNKQYRENKKESILNKNIAEIMDIKLRIAQLNMELVNIEFKQQALKSEILELKNMEEELQKGKDLKEVLGEDSE